MHLRFRATNASGTVAAVCGTNTISFGLLPYFCSVIESLGAQASNDASLFLVEDATWQADYAAGELRAKRLAAFVDMTL